MASIRAFVPQPIPDIALKRLREICEVDLYPRVDNRITRQEVLERVRDKEILFALGEIPFDREVLEAANALKMIAAMHISAWFVDQEAASERRIPVSGVPNGELARTTAELTFALLLATVWRIAEGDRMVRAQQWVQNQSMALLTTRMYGKTLGIIGMGPVGQQVAWKAANLDLRIIYTKRDRLSPEREAELRAQYVSMEELLAAADFVVLTPALNRETENLMDAAKLNMMKQGSVLINTSRGEIVDEAALAAAIESGHLRGAGLDVYRAEIPHVEVPGPHAALTGLPNVTFTPHIGSAAVETREWMALRTVENIRAFLDKGRPIDILNPQIYGTAAGSS